MTDRAKFEQMLEYLINEDQQKAEELFHELVVAKSREIYENLLDDDMQVDQTDEDFDMSEVSDDKAGDSLDDLDADADKQKEKDDEMGPPEDEEEGGGDEPATVNDLDLMKQDIIDALTAEFEAQMGGKEEGGEEGGNMDMEMDMDAEPKEEDLVLEYVEKVAPAKMGDDGAYTKSPSLNKNTKINSNGAKAVNFSGESNKGGTQGGLANPSVKDLNSGNVNTPGSKNATKLSAQSKGHGAEKKGSGDNGANTKSTIGSR